MSPRTRHIKRGRRGVGNATTSTGGAEATTPGTGQVDTEVHDEEKGSGGHHDAWAAFNENSRRRVWYRDQVGRCARNSYHARRVTVGEGGEFGEGRVHSAQPGWAHCCERVREHN